MGRRLWILSLRGRLWSRYDFGSPRLGRILGTAALAVVSSAALRASTPLTLSQDGATVYDTANNITWLADVNLPASNTFGLPYCNGAGPQPCVNPDGSMKYAAAAAWVAAMNAANYVGHSNWQLPTTTANDSGCGRKGPTGQSFGFGCSASAFGTLWNNLGLKAPNTAVPIPNYALGPFSNFQPYLYWSQSGAPPPAGNYTFSFATGWQGANTLPNLLYVLPMIPGKVPGSPSAAGSGLQVNPGGQTIYDPGTNITWVTNANLAATNGFGLPACTDPTTPTLCVAPDGSMTFASANQFIVNMNNAAYLGQTNWQLPVIDSGCPGYNCAGSLNPMGNLFYNQLGFNQGMSVTAAPNIAVGPFHDIQPYLYWACMAPSIQSACQADGPAANFEWSFSFGSGFEGTDLLANDLYVTAYYVGTSTSGPGPVTTLPHVADGNGFNTIVLLINTGGSDAAYSMQFFDQSGAPVSYPLDPSQSGMSGTVHAGSQAIVRTAASGNTTHVGWGQLIAPAAVKGMLIYQQQASTASLQEGSAPFTAPAEHFFVPFDNTPGSTTSVGFVNPNATQTAAITFTIRYESGGTDIVPVVNLDPLQQVAETVGALWAGTAGKRGLIEVTAGTPIGMVAFRFQGAALTLFDTIPETSRGSEPILSTIAHSADGNGFKSTFLLTNSGTVAAPYTLSIMNTAGQPQLFNFDVASPLSGTIAAGDTLTIDTTGLGTATNLGWAQLSAPPAVSGIEVFRQTNPGKSEQQATIPISQTTLAHFFLPFDNAANTTSIALANPNPAATATMNVTFRYTDGSSNASPLNLVPRNYLASQLAILFPATAGKAGVAEFVSNVPVSVVEVRFNPTQAFTSLRAVGP